VCCLVVTIAPPSTVAQSALQPLGLNSQSPAFLDKESVVQGVEHFQISRRFCQGVILSSVEMVKNLMAKATTRTGLKVFTTILDGVYKTGQKATEEFKQMMEIVFDEDLSQWNYTAKPQNYPLFNP
jgi:hypothetical protein